MKLDFLGGALEVGGSSILLKINNKNILLDAGIRQNANKDSIPNFRTIQDNGGLDAIIISHAHLDHIGCLPLISNEYPNAKIFMNNMTKDLVRVLLYDSLKIMNNRESEIPLYSEKDVKFTLDRIFTINYLVRFPIFEDLHLTFYNAGHIAGASCIYLESREGAMFYSGDFSVFSQKTVEGAKLPKLRPDVAILESTYGDKLHSNREVEEKALINIVNECIENNGKMIIPAFALGRAQEVILILKSAMNKGSLKKVKVYVDGMVRDINRVYKNNPLYLKNSLGKKILKGIEPFYDENIIEVKLNDNREEILSKKEPVVIISSSGMITGGPSAFYAEKIATMENGYIVITGYQDEESPGKKILDLANEEEEERYLSINNLNIPVKCTVKKVGLSAHADKSEIKGLIDRISPRNIFLVHGNEEVIKTLATEVSRDFIGRTFTPECGESIKVNINNPRKQLTKKIPYLMNKESRISKENIKELWDFISKIYEDRLFTIEELLYLWKGKVSFDNEEIIYLKNIIIDTVYFESDNRRLFLFKAKKEEDILESLKPKQINQQILIEKVEEIFKEFEYRKISILLQNKEVILNFDFPQGVDKSIKGLMKNFEDETSWKININEKINNGSAEILIKKSINPNYIKKISFYPDKFYVEVFLNCKNMYGKEICDDFQEKTGWKLLITEEGEKSEVEDKNKVYFQVSDCPMMEQNNALQAIDKAFEEEIHKPYKKCIKNNENGKYLELVFISPKIGEKFSEKLGHLSKETGWTIALSDKVNQAEIINILKLLCDKYDIKLKKNPSYLGNMNFLITLTEEIENFKKLKEEFEKVSGCVLNLKYN
ncbi:MBL fold metallo-hydrolase [Clostridium weizhouense]|uniref:MBL fold metallo-hydrolase n=1 Tax=Clostridium weizhouense TaxID=2859781 RepID=A0ABS7APD5_9CLOT|nr:MBL fold metallo-hydrolase RNA specificity domain-containing protein [Clostridium weizhouense]MBW6409365.1 MBL fold metallo-hydrolase [Clostridium weizhouense]